MNSNDLEDLRGRQFEWRGAGGVVEIVEDPVVVGQVVRLSDRPAYRAEIAGDRLFIEHSVGVLGASFEAQDASTQALRAKSYYARDTTLRAILDDREYSLRRSDGVAVWSGDDGDAVSLRSGEAFVLMGADLRDAAVLLLLGIVMALENSLFPVARVRGM